MNGAAALHRTQQRRPSRSIVEAGRSWPLSTSRVEAGPHSGAIGLMHVGVHPYASTARRPRCAAARLAACGSTVIEVHRDRADRDHRAGRPRLLSQSTAAMTTGAVSPPDSHLVARTCVGFGPLRRSRRAAWGDARSLEGHGAAPKIWSCAQHGRRTTQIPLRASLSRCTATTCRCSSPRSSAWRTARCRGNSSATSSSKIPKVASEPTFCSDRPGATGRRRCRGLRATLARLRQQAGL